jgi:hypothetical protein
MQHFQTNSIFARKPKRWGAAVAVAQWQSD